MPQARIMFDLEKHGADQLGRAIRHLPSGGQLTMAGTGLTLIALHGAARRFLLRLPPRLDYQPEVRKDALKAAATTTAEVVRVHQDLTKHLAKNTPPEWRDTEE